MNYVLDTNIISELVSKQPNQKIIDWLDALDPNTVYLTVITIGEIQKGIEKLPPSKRKDDLSEWLQNNLLARFEGRILDLTTEVSLIWGTLVGRLEKGGNPMAAIDSLIAAIVLQGNYTLVTRNDHDFQPAEISIINPWRDV